MSASALVAGGGCGVVVFGGRDAGGFVDLGWKVGKEELVRLGCYYKFGKGNGKGK
jgi:hypothetical protein